MMNAAHCTPEDIASYVDRRAGSPERHRVESHCATCHECRGELLEVAEIVGETKATSRPWLLPLAAAAAVVLVLGRSEAFTRRHREPVLLAAVAPATVSPGGVVHGLDRLVWTSVAGADEYRVSVFDAAGGVLWETSTPDTTVAMSPDDVARLGEREQRFWSVRARVAWDRWTESPLTEFRIDGGDRIRR